MTRIRTRKTTRLKTSRLILGTMGMEGPARDDPTGLIHAAIDLGVSSIDTAPLYGTGRAEEIVGMAIRDRRDQVQILTKCGLRWDSEHGAAMFEMSLPSGKAWVRKDSRPISIRQGIDESLQRLGIETIDLMQIHQLDIDTPLNESLGELDRAVASGKIRAIGISNFPLREMQEAMSILKGRLFSVQDEFNLLSRSRSEGLRQACAKDDVQFLAYSPLAHGVLSGRLLHIAIDELSSHPHSYYSNLRNHRMICHMLRTTALPLAEKYDLTLSQLCLLWALGQEGVDSVIAGASRIDQIVDNAGILSADIPQEELDSLTSAVTALKLDSSVDNSLKQRIKRAGSKLRSMINR